ncbi:hypothetical protein R1flu_000378 [Riccia fluitans]|uniref:Uncharacterized protein n=1 Tax=Riccia fluitans TaxID=41844 RepID=A0ABD1Y094_9MARC
MNPSSETKVLEWKPRLFDFEVQSHNFFSARDAIKYAIGDSASQPFLQFLFGESLFMQRDQGRIGAKRALTMGYTWLVGADVTIAEEERSRFCSSAESSSEHSRAILEFRLPMPRTRPIRQNLSTERESGRGVPSPPPPGKRQEFTRITSRWPDAGRKCRRKGTTVRQVSRNRKESGTVVYAKSSEDLGPAQGEIGTHARENLIQFAYCKASSGV